MNFGKTEDLSQIDFTLPQPKVEHRILPPANEIHIRLGGTAWTTKEWKGSLYPPKAKPSEFLHYYAQSFESIELNTTFYRMPDTGLIEKWREEAGGSFKFCPKVNQSISHRKDFGIDRSKVTEFCSLISLFEDNLGISFIQLPEYFDFSDLPRLETFLSTWSVDLPIAIELRNATFFESETNQRRLFDVLEKFNASAVLTDVAGHRNLLHMHVSTPQMMIRWVGNGLHPTDFKRIDDWFQNISAWKTAGVSDIYLFTHEPDNIHVPEIASYFIANVKNVVPNALIKNLKWRSDGKPLTLF